MPKSPETRRLWEFGPNRAAVKKKGASASAERQQYFFPKRVFEFLELQRRFTLIAQDFQHGRSALFRHLDTRILQMHNMHLQGLH
jgi:hypothetical protein